MPLSLLPQMNEEAEEELKKSYQGEHAYFGLGLRQHGLEAHQAGGKKDIVAMPGIALDIDLEDPGAHKTKEQLPRNEEEAYSIIETLPDPSSIVHTGHGWQAFWFFDKPYLLSSVSDRTQFQKSYKAFLKEVIDHAKGLGLHIDNTASIHRIWRVPGFANLKKGDASTIVKVLHLDEKCRYSPRELLPLPKPRSATISKKIQSGDQLQNLIDRLSRLYKDHQHKSAIEKLLLGESFADSERDNAMQSLCSYIAWLPEAEDLTAEQIAELFRSSVSVWAAEEGAEKTVQEEMAKVIDKLQRAQQDKLEKKEQEREELQGLREFLKGREEDKEDEKPEKILQHTIIQKKTTLYVFDFDKQQYIGPKVKEELAPFARDAWISGPAGLRLDYLNDKGEKKWKTVPTLLREYAKVTPEICGVLGLEKSYYDLEDEIFYESMAPLRNLEPVFNKEIDKWLHLLAGDSIEKLLDWIAAVTLLDEQCCCLYLEGVSGAGKGLLANGLSRLWHQAGPTPLENVISNFNAEMFKCPLVFLDEGLPPDSRPSANQFRSLIGTSTFTLNEKHITPRFVKGSVRLLIAANNDEVLDFSDGIRSINDLEAIVSRFLHIKAQKEAKDWLEKHNEDRKKTKSWVEEGLIAKHALWLRDNREIKPGKRFIVEGEKLDDMHRKLILANGSNGLVIEWLVRFASNPDAVYQPYATKKQMPLAQIGDGQLLINTQGIIDCWNIYIDDKFRKPTTAKIGKVLNQISEGIHKRGSGSGRGKTGPRVRFHKIKTDLVLSWASTNQVGNEDQIKLNLEQKLPR